MNVDLNFAIRVQRLAREDIKVAAIAARLRTTEALVMDALNALGLPVPGELFEAPARISDDSRAALRDKMPKRMQDRMRRIADTAK